LKCTSHQPILVAVFGLMANHTKRLVLSCVQNLFLNFNLGGRSLLSVLEYFPYDFRPGILVLFFFFAYGCTVGGNRLFKIQNTIFFSLFNFL